MEFRIKQLGAVAFLALLVAAPAGAQKVYRWVDEDGNVHYTESLPPGFKDTGHDVLNERGIVVDENLKLTPQRESEKKDEERTAPRLVRPAAAQAPLYRGAEAAPDG